MENEGLACGTFCSGVEECVEVLNFLYWSKTVCRQSIDFFTQTSICTMQQSMISYGKGKCITKLCHPIFVCWYILVVKKDAYHPHIFKIDTLNNTQQMWMLTTDKALQLQCKIRRRCCCCYAFVMNVVRKVCVIPQSTTLYVQCKIDHSQEIFEMKKASTNMTFIPTKILLEVEYHHDVICFQKKKILQTNQQLCYSPHVAW